MNTAPKAIAAGPVKTFPIPRTNPLAKALPSSSPPPSIFLMPSIWPTKNSKNPPISGFTASSPIMPANSRIPVPA